MLTVSGALVGALAGMPNLISPEHGAELEQLDAQRLKFFTELVAIKTDTPAHQLTGEPLRRSVELVEKVSVINRRRAEIKS
jgi:hypothetical protein